MEFCRWTVAVGEPAPGRTSLVGILISAEIIDVRLRGLVLLPHHPVIRRRPDLAQPLDVAPPPAPDASSSRTVCPTSNPFVLATRTLFWPFCRSALRRVAVMLSLYCS